MAKKPNDPTPIHLKDILSPILKADISAVRLTIRHNLLILSPQLTIVGVQVGNTAKQAKTMRSTADTTSQGAPGQDLAQAQEAPKAFHHGFDSEQSVWIAGLEYRIVHPKADGSYYVVYKKKNYGFTITSGMAQSGADSEEEHEQEESLVREVDGYRLTFWNSREITHEQQEELERREDTPEANLMGMLLEIYRKNTGREYFVLVNYYFAPAGFDDTGATGSTSQASEKNRNSAENEGLKSATPISERCLDIELKSGKTVVTRRRFYLDDPPLKLGDGSFGAVYQVREQVGQTVEAGARDSVVPDRPTRDHPGKRYALKVFYNRQMMTRTGLIRVEPETFNPLLGKCGDAIDCVEEISIARFLQYIFQSLRKGAAINEVERQAYDVLKQSEHLQNVSARRFGREREISSQIKAVFDADGSVNVNEIACVQTEFDATAFRSSAMFTFLTNPKRYKGFNTVDNLSDYAIVMEWCNYTLEDVLEAQWHVWAEHNGDGAGEGDGAGGDTGVAVREVHKTIYRARPVPEMNRLVRVNEGSSDREAKVPKYAKIVTGYDILQSLPFSLRLAVVCPYMEGLAEAIQMLHASGNYHHDIKPGNVFLKITRNSFSVAIGDFSFVGSDEDRGTTEAVLRESIQTGSLYFRSPEQRDFNDAAYGEVRRVGADQEKGGAENRTKVNEKRGGYVRITDPKFRGSTIGRNDVVVFPADRYGTAYRVLEVCDGENHRDVWLNVDPEEFARIFPEPTRTKVFLYKVPTVKSDLFGLGAVFFDLVTGGWSAERFYEALRPFDVPGRREEAWQGEKKGEGGWAAETITRGFKRFRGDSGGEADMERQLTMGNIFQWYEGTGEYKGQYAPADVVHIIVKLMGANLTDSYSNIDPRQRPVAKHLKDIKPLALPVTWVLEDIRKLADKGVYRYDDMWQQRGMNNVLLRPEESQGCLEMVVRRHGAAGEESGSEIRGGRHTGSANSGRRSIWGDLRKSWRDSRERGV